MDSRCNLFIKGTVGVIIFIKGTVGVITSDPQFVKWHFRFTAVPFLYNLFFKLKIVNKILKRAVNVL